VVAQLAAQRKETAATRSELETLKLSQKFLVRQPRGGARIPAEKMDLMNMVNHLLHEVRVEGGVLFVVIQLSTE
jgi:urease gamma subunit